MRVRRSTWLKTIASATVPTPAKTTVSAERELVAVASARTGTRPRQLGSRSDRPDPNCAILVRSIAPPHESGVLRTCRLTSPQSVAAATPTTRTPITPAGRYVGRREITRSDPRRRREAAPGWAPRRETAVRSRCPRVGGPSSGGFRRMTCSGRRQTYEHRRCGDVSRGCRA
jgi:hypothetical protein